MTDPLDEYSDAMFESAGSMFPKTEHKIVSGETPVVGMRVFTYDWSWGTITHVATDCGCGTYCNAWHTVKIDDDAKYCAGQTKTYNCDRLTTKEPK